MNVPAPRGPLSRHVADALRSDAPFHALPVPETDEVLRDDDHQLALWMLYEQSYRGFDDASDHEWDPAAVAARRALETPFEAVVRERTATVVASALAASDDLVAQVTHVIDADDGPDLARFLHRDASREQVLDFLALRSLYHLKESDPHAFVVPRVDGAAKVALVELQYDEFGAGRPDRLHSRLYAEALDAAGLDSSYGAYVDRVPASTLAVNNLMSLLGLHRRLRGAALGHLAAFESTSAVPCRRIAAGIERVGLPDVTAAYFHEHVEADSAHEQVAVRDVCGAFVRDEPDQRATLLLGVAACLDLDALAAEDLLAQWSTTEELAS